MNGHASTVVGGGSGTGLGVLVVWFAGQFGHLAIPAEVGVVIGALCLALGGAIGAYGIRGCATRLWRGRNSTPDQPQVGP